MTTEYSRADVKAHNKSTDCWIIYKGEVFDVTQFLHKHPGGEDSLLECGGADATSSFNDIGHSSSALNQMKKFKIGVLKKASTSFS